MQESNKNVDRGRGDFAARLKAVRKQRRWTQDKVAQHLGVSRNWISQLENGLSPGEDLVEKVTLMEQGAEVYSANELGFQTLDQFAGELATWRTRAILANEKLTLVRQGLASLAKLLEEPLPTPPAAPVGKASRSEASPRSHTPSKAKRSQLRDIDTVSIPIFGTIPAGWTQARIGVHLPDRFERVRRGRFPEGAFGLEVRGDSMNASKPEPIQDGETVILIPSELREPRGGDIVAALCDGQSTLKRLVCPPGHPCFLHAESKDPAFARDIVPAHDLVIQGVMLGKL